MNQIVVAKTILALKAIFKNNVKNMIEDDYDKLAHDSLELGLSLVGNEQGVVKLINKYNSTSRIKGLDVE